MSKRTKMLRRQKTDPNASEKRTRGRARGRVADAFQAYQANRTERVQARQQGKTDRAEDRQQSYADRTFSKAAGGKWSPESVGARWSGIEGMTGQLAQLASGAASAYFTGGASSSMGGLSGALAGAQDVLSGVQDVLNPSTGGEPGGETPLPTPEESGWIGWVEANPVASVAIAGGALWLLYQVLK